MDDNDDDEDEMRESNERKLSLEKHEKMIARSFKK
jgi:hypothetical protein